MVNRPFTVFVEGNIGSGKTTFLKHFEDFVNVHVALEPVELWQDVNGFNILDLMYQNPSKWSFAFQSIVQKTMLDIHTRHCSEPIKLMERSLKSGRYVFIENLRRQEVMSEPEYVVLTSCYESMSKNFDIQGDLIIYLRSDPEVVFRRMKERARTEEGQVSLDYLKQVHELHENWLIHKTATTDLPPVLVIDGNCSMNSMKEKFKKCQDIIFDYFHRPESINLSGMQLAPSTMNILTSIL